MLAPLREIAKPADRLVMFRGAAGKQKTIALGVASLDVCNMSLQSMERSLGALWHQHGLVE